MHIHNETTFGFEAEFDVNAAGVIARLYEDGLAGMPTLHGYHCDCEQCAFSNGMAFRGQTDSSCSGEIISDVMGGCDSDYNAQDMIRALSRTAIDVDAEPGLTSAFHVHVGISHLSFQSMADILWQFTRWETVLMRIAGGRWPNQRQNMNNMVQECIEPQFHCETGKRFTTEVLGSYTPSQTLLESLLRAQQCADRHSNLNVSGRRTPTWEFRLWNATRSAWRMEMFCGLSVALTDLDVIQSLGTQELPDDEVESISAGIDAVAIALDHAGYERISELVLRQAHYLDKRAESAPATLTLL